MSRRTPALAVAGLAASALLTGCAAGEPDDAAAPSGSPTGTPAAFQPCPDQPAARASGADLLPAVAFDCLGGGTLDLGRAPGVPTVVNLWASWCGPCREELPLMQQLADAAGGRLRVVGVVSKDGRDQAGAFAADVRVGFPSAFDEQGELMTRLGLNGLPYTYLLDADGAVAFTQVGPVRSEQQLRDLVEEELGVAP